MKRKAMNDEHEQDCKDAREAEIGADRMRRGLSCIPDPVFGDLVAVAARDLRIQELEAELRERHWAESPEKMGA